MFFIFFIKFILPILVALWLLWYFWPRAAIKVEEVEQERQPLIAKAARLKKENLSFEMGKALAEKKSPIKKTKKVTKKTK